MSDTEITIFLKGNPDDPDLVEADALALLLQRTVKVLRSIANDLGGGSSLRVLVRDLKQGSAQVTLELRRKRRAKQRLRPADVGRLFTSGTAVMDRGGKFPSPLSLLTVERFGEIADVLRPGLTATYGLNGTSVSVSPIWKARAEGAKEVGRAVDGFLRGHLEGIDLHGQVRFFLYPVLAERRVECHFKTDQLEDVKGALGRYVGVHGVQRFDPHATWPARIDVDSLAVFPPAERIPSMKVLKGLLSSLGRGMTVSEHVARAGARNP